MNSYLFFDFQWIQKGLKLQIQDEEVRDVMFCSDPDRIKQIMMNLISNAYKFTNQGSITLNFSLFDKSERNNNSRILKVEVIDTGIGIPEEDIKNLFQLFGMIDRHRQQFNMKGTGLGLTISKKLVTLLGGEITLESKENIGTKVSFTIKENEIDSRVEETKSIRINNNLQRSASNANMFNSLLFSQNFYRDYPSDSVEYDCTLNF